jgi:predicted porin
MKFKSGSLVVLIVFSAAAHAQSSVTLYGVADSGLLYQSTSAATFQPRAPNLGHVYELKDGGIYSSFWGLKGSEDIGGGYKITFKLQGTFNTTNGKSGLSDTPGTTALFNQYATVGATGPFGTFDAGRQIIPMIYAMAETDVRGAQYFGSIMTATRWSTVRRNSMARRLRWSTRRVGSRDSSRAARASRPCSSIRITV